VDGQRARALVEAVDEQAFLVGVDWERVPEKRALHTFCNCPDFASGEKCEHVWAALMAIGEESPESQPFGADRLSVRRDRPDRWVELGPSVQDAVSTTTTTTPQSARARGTRSGGVASWRSQLAALRDDYEMPIVAPTKAPPRRQSTAKLHFLINTRASQGKGGLVLDVFNRRPGRSGKRGQFRRGRIEPTELSGLLLPTGPMGRQSEENRSLEIITALSPDGATRKRRTKRRAKKKSSGGLQRFRLPRSLYEPVLSHLSQNGALGWWDGSRPSGGQDIAWDRGRPWHLALRLEPTSGAAMRLAGTLERNGDSVPLSEPLLILSTGESTRPLIVFSDSIARLASAGDLRWIDMLRGSRDIIIPAKDLQEALAELSEIPDLPRLEVPEELGFEEETSPHRPRLVFEKGDSVLRNAPLAAELSFLYGDIEVKASDARTTIVDDSGHTLLRRDMAQEHKSLVRLLEAGARPVAGGQSLEVDPREVPAVAEPLLREGWDIELQGTTLRPPSPASLRIESGIDWFEVSGDIEFQGDAVDLKKIVEAVRKGERFVELADGSHGLVPESVSEAVGSLTDLSQGETEDGLKFFSSQALLVDALMIDMPPVTIDDAFAELRDKLESFESIEPKKEPRGFRGELRAYQRDGLGWLEFLREYGLGGILADDMGLGKTVQVLALLRANRTPKKTTGLPSLVVVPRSLLYNWLDEANRFTPTLKVVEYGGPGREKLQAKFGKYDVIVTTYGTLRRDIGFLATVEFDTVILDEAQAIKNRDSQAAKASRLLDGRHRLALTGTPIENHLGELGSIFEFLNPGIVGRLPVLEVLASGRQASGDELARVAEGVRPFILRRTKAQVLPDLPPKTEQVLHTTLNERQRELYDQLRAGYQVSLLQQAESEGPKGATLEVLEALLRLRQIACHPGLVNDEWADAGSAKLDALFELVTEVLEEGHKVLVFSQFTKLLGFVRERFDEIEVPYAYLDGQTRNRGEVVERFQTDPATNIFLVSLKAGGVGLNLTAASYVFLLDPWWNPAVEAQALDRAHRIGQTQPVFAYRMIAQDTVEEKIVELQASKRQIADAILEGEGGTLSDLTAEDLQMLLS
jgi:superfamily II DNA or RNA helicase